MQTIIEQFEETTGLTFDANGPDVVPCPYCNVLLQFIPDHDCFGIQGESREAHRMEYDER